MRTFYFSCGQNHRHYIGHGKVWDRNSLLAIEAETIEQAEEKITERFGNKWSMSYGELQKDYLEHWPNGIIKL